VLLMPEGTRGGAGVRGGAPASHEFALLEPGRVVERVDAIVFSGGSAFGLATAHGVMRYCAERGRGFRTRGGPVPIVPTAAIFDLAETGPVRPGPSEGYAAAILAERDEPFATGRVGAGRGATVGKWRGGEHSAAGGLGFAHARVDAAQVVAIAVVNAVGDVVDREGRVLAGTSALPDVPAFPDPRPFEAAIETGNTTLVAVVTDGRCDKLGCHLVAQSAHDGFARALVPSHTRYDGDVAIACSTGTVEVHFDRLRMAAADVVAAAIRDAVTPR
jgi:L-aminopeptidase/D-esterase-like protein